jgi:protoporphyrinogen oxidase
LKAKGKKTAIIIGAGPAGLTTAYELLQKTDIKPLVFEVSNDMGGLSKTVNYKGNRIDIGGHRFFSKSDRVMQWWNAILPIENTSSSKEFLLKYQGDERSIKGGVGGDPAKTDDVMLVRSRLSRIYYGGKFYSYPVALDATTIKNLGLWRMTKMGVSYAKARLRPLREQSLEDFFVNRFGRELYNTFFREYTEKVWGVPCAEIDAHWGAQRVKGLSVSKAVGHALKKQLNLHKKGDLSQQCTETSLIEHFLYPKFGPGQMWGTVAERVKKQGGEIFMNAGITKIHAENHTIAAVTAIDMKTGKTREMVGDYFFSTMPIKELIESFDGVRVPKNVHEVASKLPYRDFITVGLLLKKLKIKNETNHKTKGNIVPDNWIYIQEPGVKVGRLQVFNNWSPYMVKDSDSVWIGMEYFVSEGDDLWVKRDQDMAAFGIRELASIGIIDAADVLDSTVIRVKKTYPAYFGTYSRFDEVRQFIDKFDNLFLLGRNGQHRYNNQDHSMLTAMVAVDNIVAGRTDKTNIWDVNVEEDYHED